MGPSANPFDPAATYSTSYTGSAIDAGNYQVQFDATGSYTGSSGLVDWVIHPAPQGTVAISPASQTVTAGQSITFTAAGGATGNYNWGGSAGASGSGNTRAVTFSSLGTFTVTVQDVGDGNWNPSNVASATITVNPNTPPPPAITSPATWRIPQGAVVKPYQITATNSPTSFGLIGTLPAGLTFTSATGQIGGTPTQSGTYGVTVTATNAGGTGSQTLTITVVAGGLVPNATVSTPGTGTVFAGRLYVKPTDTVTLQPGGTADLGVYWTENVIWRPDGSAKTNPNQVTPNHFVALGYTPDNGAGLYSYQMRLVDTGQNFIDQHVQFSVDSAAPSVPAGLFASNIFVTSFTLNWSASSDDVGVTAYEVFRDGSSLGTTTATSLDVNGLAPGTTYAMTVRARDAAGNWSAPSAPARSQVPVTSADGAAVYGDAFTASASGGSGTGAYVYRLISGGSAAGGSVSSSGIVSAASTGTVLFQVQRGGDANHLVSAWSPTYTVTFNRRAITVTLRGSKLYDGTTTPTDASATVPTSALASGDSIAYTFAPTSSPNVGMYTGLASAAISNTGAPVSRTGSYTIIYGGSYRIDPRPQDPVTSADGTATYGDAFTASASGGNGTGAYVYQLISGGSAAGGSVSSSGVVSAASTGTVLFQVQRAGDANHLVSAWSPTYTVTFNQRAITVTLTGRKNYDGTTTPTGASASITSGTLASGDSIAYTFAPTSSPNAGTYTGLVSATISNTAAPVSRTGSYTIIYGGSYRIDPRPQDPVTCANGTATYGDTFTASASGGNGTGAYVYQLSPGGSAAGGSVSSSGVVSAASTGTVLFQVQRAGDANHLVSAWSLTCMVTFVQRDITVTLTGGKIYDGTTTPTGASASITSGTLASGDSIAYTFAPTSSPNAGTYTGLVSATISNTAAPTDRTPFYTITYAGSYRIDPKPVTFSLSQTSFTYNGSAQGPTVIPSDPAATFTTGGTLSAINADHYTATATATGNYTGNNDALDWTIDKADQTLTFANPGPQVSSMPLTLVATASSGLSVSFSVTAGLATLDGATVTFTGAGDVTVSASQAGDGNWNPAADVSQTFRVYVDSDGDGLPDEWEALYLGTLDYGASEDPGHVGRTLLQSWRQGASPWPLAVVPNGLRAWYRADADASVGRDGSGKVNRWTDVSGHGFHVFQTADPSRRPLWIAEAGNHQPALSFDDSAGMILETGAAVDLQDYGTGGADVTVIAVVQPDATQAVASTLVDFSWIDSQGFHVWQGTADGNTNRYRLGWANTGTTEMATPALTAAGGQVGVLSTVKRRTNATAYLNGLVQGTNPVAPEMYVPAAAVFALGNTATQRVRGFHGQLAEVLVYNRALSDAERAQIEAQLLTKYVDPDSDGDGLRDTWEDQQLGTRAWGAGDDPGGVGRTLLVTYHRPDLSPWPTATVTNGLRAWYRADAGVLKDASGKVSLWADASGHGFHVSQTADASRQPLWLDGAINGQPALSYDDSARMTLETSVQVDLQAVQADSDDLTLIAVVQPEAIQPTASTLVDFSHYGGPWGFHWWQGADSTNHYYLEWAGPGPEIRYTQRTPGLAAAAGRVQVISTLKNGTSVADYLDGALQATDVMARDMHVPVARLAVGNVAGFPEHSFHGQIAEILIYNRALSDTERAQIEAQLMSKYN